jgi:hypothetical protein
MLKLPGVMLAAMCVAAVCGFTGLAAEKAGDSRGDAASPAIAHISAHGKVVDSQRRPEANARVVLRIVASRVGSELAMIDVPDVLAATRTDAEGRFDFTDVPLDSSMMQIVKTFEQGRRGADVVALADGFGMSWTPLNALSTDEELEIVLMPAAAVEGTIENPEGAPLAGAVVELIGVSRLDSSDDTFLEQPENLNLIWSALRPKAITDVDGRFRIDGLPADHRVNVWASHVDHPQGYFVAAIGEHASPEPIIRKRGNGAVEETPVYVNPVQLKLARGPRVTVHVRDSKGRPLGGGRVALVPVSHPRGSTGRVPEDGTLHIAVEAPDDYHLMYRPPEAEPGPSVGQEVTLTEADIATRRELTITVPATSEVTGRIIGEATDRGLPGISVIWSPEGADDRLPSPFARTMTDGNGRFRLAVPPGKGRITWQGEAAGFFIPFSRKLKGLQQEKFSRSIDVPQSGKMELLRIEIARGLVIQGTVADASGQPAAGIGLAAIGVADYGTLPTKAKTDAQGRFEIAGLDPRDPYRLFATSDGAVAVASISPDESHPLDESRIVKVRLVLERCVTLTGQVLFGGEPLAGVKLALKLGEPVQKPAQAPGGKRPVAPVGATRLLEISGAVTDANGRYRLSGLQPGDSYQIDVKPPFPAVDPAWHYGFGSMPQLPDNAEATFALPDMNMRRLNQSLTGVVVDPDGNPIAGAQVSCMLRDGFASLARTSLNGPPPWTETDKSGRFRLQQLPDEPLSIMAYIKKPGDLQIRFPAKVNAELNQQDIRIVLDPSLAEEE